MSELTMLIDTTSGAYAPEHSHLSADALIKLRPLQAKVRNADARLLDVTPPPTMLDLQTGEAQVRIAGYYHNRLSKGPAGRSFGALPVLPVVLQRMLGPIYT
ncbi:MAG: hypothetical protein IPJ55_18975 [Chloracidobacterium sp.]|nr:hypothetical protein [Chloracidobacterium sp.]